MIQPTPAERLLDFFGPNGERWVKGRMTKYNSLDGTYSACLIGAQLLNGISPEHRAKLRSIVMEQFGDRGMNIPDFNDHPDTTFDDIRLVLEKWNVHE